MNGSAHQDAALSVAGIAGARGTTKADAAVTGLVASSAEGVARTATALPNFAQSAPQGAPVPGMTTIDHLSALVEIQEESTVSRTVLKQDGVRIVLFGFAAGQVLTEHTAAMPVLLTVLEGELRITADGRTDTLLPGGVIHLDTRLPHAVEAVSDAILALTMIDARAKPTLPDAVAGQANLLAPASGCDCGHDTGAEPHIDARTLPGLIRHPAIIGAFESLVPGASLVVIAGHLPRHLLEELGERGPYSYEVLEEGPEAWKVRLTKP